VEGFLRGRRPPQRRPFSVRTSQELVSRPLILDQEINAACSPRANRKTRIRSGSPIIFAGNDSIGSIRIGGWPLCRNACRLRVITDCLPSCHLWHLNDKAITAISIGRVNARRNARVNILHHCLRAMLGHTMRDTNINHSISPRACVVPPSSPPLSLSLFLFTFHTTARANNTRRKKITRKGAGGAIEYRTKVLRARYLIIDNYVSALTGTASHRESSSILPRRGWGGG